MWQAVACRWSRFTLQAGQHSCQCPSLETVPPSAACRILTKQQRIDSKRATRQDLPQGYPSMRVTQCMLVWIFLSFVCLLARLLPASRNGSPARPPALCTRVLRRAAYALLCGAPVCAVLQLEQGLSGQWDQQARPRLQSWSCCQKWPHAS